MQSYAWPGNIRELKNCIERAVILEAGDEIEADSLGIGAQTSTPSSPVTVTLGGEIQIPETGIDLAGHLESIERKYLQEALARCSGNQSQAAKRLGMTRDILRYRLKKYGLENAAGGD